MGELFFIYCGMVTLSVTAAFFGVFMVLRRMSLMTDALSHATLPGIILGFCLMPHSWIGMFCAGVMSGLFGAAAVLFLERHTHLKMDTILGVILSVFFGSGLVLYSLLHRFSSVDQGMVMRLLLGNPALITRADALLLISIASFLWIACLIVYRQLVMVIFDRAGAAVLGYSVLFYDLIILFFLLAIISLGLPLVGVMLTSSLIVAPAVVGLQFCTNIIFVQMVAVAVAALSSVGGLMISGAIAKMPAGPIISIIAIVLAIASIVGCHFFKKGK